MHDLMGVKSAALRKGQNMMVVAMPDSHSAVKCLKLVQ